MTLIKLIRHYSLMYLIVNIDAIDSIYEEYNVKTDQNDYNVLLRSGVVYDITKNCFDALSKQAKEL